MRGPVPAGPALTPAQPARALPDVAVDALPQARALDAVGMAQIALPVRLAGGLVVPASVDVEVDLADPRARGIHMSRLYLHLQQAFAADALDPALLRRTLGALVDSQNGLSTRARLIVRYDHLLLRPALSSGHAGWKRYPVCVQATGNADAAELSVSVAVEYSSTCPASTALSRQLNAEGFLQAFGTATPLSTTAVAHWMASPEGLAATPHAQRSRCDATVVLDRDAGGWAVDAWVDAIEAALGTPVQTAVKREDEQAFARLNAQNLMFCEDAARRVATALASLEQVERFEVAVAHFESLHAHDAVARVRGTRA